MSALRFDELPLWPAVAFGATLGALFPITGRLIGHYLGTHVPAYLTALDAAHDIDLPEETP